MLNVKVYRPANRFLGATDAVTLATWVSESLDGGAKHLAIDLQHVSFMDSRGLGALVLAHNRIRKANATLGLCSVTGQAEMLLDLTSMRKEFKIYDSVSQFKAAIADEHDNLRATAPIHPR